jgi:hypothetical protein
MKDFFGRDILITEQQKKSKNQKSILCGLNLDCINIIYRYKEGYSNAVRKKINLEVFL